MSGDGTPSVSFLCVLLFVFSGLCKGLLASCLPTILFICPSNSELSSSLEMKNTNGGVQRRVPSCSFRTEWYAPSTAETFKTSHLPLTNSLENEDTETDNMLSRADELNSEGGGRLGSESGGGGGGNQMEELAVTPKLIQDYRSRLYKKHQTEYGGLAFFDFLSGCLSQVRQ
uniref:Uncharacterized protein n=1 Tax=Chromera velia CCMP2878 TaxID=1169474 RepID=A0A0G4HKM9_9ALVE|eukprot:Cvel_7269.t1-p1 / transcript=Cvel_7269.t1 / gene=Cvel_7269 / organism=Chromera_velia_CCMP2878 / gene_product=hypothetical protein / transcript_product=hypothetical protein / location=Cvel_scaffold375:93117-93629(+) / protein_length=171 / sequence_SO=supercontig / SO=protein_coding / is_pseudo=false